MLRHEDHNAKDMTRSQLPYYAMDGQMEEYQYTISKDEINECELGCFEGSVVVIEDTDSAQSAIQYLCTRKTIGFDTESKPSFRKGEHHPISLIQLATLDTAFLFRLNKMQTIPDFSPVFSNKEIIKVGLGIKDELVELEKKLSLTCEGFADLEKVAHYHKFHQRGVRALSAFFLNIRISKSAQKSNWERSDLTQQQMRYAATDAWVCLLIYNSMTDQGFLPLENEEDVFVVINRKDDEKQP